MTDKLKAASDLIQRAEVAGCKARVQGSWVIWEPCLPVDLLMESLPINEQIGEIMRSAEACEKSN